MYISCFGSLTHYRLGSPEGPTTSCIKILPTKPSLYDRVGGKLRIDMLCFFAWLQIQISNLRPQTSNLKPQTSHLRPQISRNTDLPVNLGTQSSNLRPQTTDQRRDISHLRPHTSHFTPVLWISSTTLFRKGPVPEKCLGQALPPEKEPHTG